MCCAINVCVACDDNYSMYAGVVIASVLANASEEDFLNFYVLDGGITEEHKQQITSLKSIKDCEINFVRIDESMFEDYKQVKTHDYITLATYYRLKLPTLLKDIKRVIYFDCDFVINSSLKCLFNTDMGDYAIAGVRDINKKMLKNNPDYVNAGMLVFDISKMREQNLESKFLEWTCKHKDTIKLGDQEIINEVLKGRIKIVSDEWNVQSSNFTNRSSYTNNPKTIHFVAKKKPWHFGSFSFHRPLYFKYLQMTPWKLDEKEYKHWTFDNQIVSLIKYLEYRPLFMFRPRFYKALFCTYLLPILNLFISVEDYKETHNLLRFLGLKIKYPKREYIEKQKNNPFEHYKKDNIDITTIPPAEGQIRKIQLANLALLKELDYVCKQNGLKYWLDFGTLLGAIRHRGFIPWDDDIDTGMLREDYNKIIEAFKTTSRNPDIYAEVSCCGKGDCLIKVRHKKCEYLFLDIFPYDLYPSLQEKEQKILTKSWKKLIKKEIRPLSSKEEINSKLQELRDKIFFKTSENLDLVYGIDYNHPYDNWFCKYEFVFPLKEAEFEGYNFPVMNNTDAYLRKTFGDYMSYPKKFGMGHSMYLNISDVDNKIIMELGVL